MFDKFKDKNPVVLGLYFGAIGGAVFMMIGGAIDNTKMAELSLIMGIVAGPSIGWIIGQVRARREKQDAGKNDKPDKPF